MTDAINKLLGPRGTINDLTDVFLTAMRSMGLPVIMRAVVLEVLFDPVRLTGDKAEELRERFDTELFLLEAAPQGSVIVRPVRRAGEALCRPIVCFPFNPHSVPPIKVGEQCWLIYENDKEPHQHGYWLNRITENRFVEDVNFTHADRRFVEQAKLIGGKAQQAGLVAGELDAAPGFFNGIGSDETYSLPRDGDLKNPYDVLQEEADAAKLHVTEPVPRFRGRPGDYVMQGSNNTLVVLGEDRVGPPAEADAAGKVVGKPSTDQTSRAGTIDIVAGRGQGEASAPTEVKNTRGQVEADKNPAATGGNELQTEGDPDLDLDLSRVLISMSTAVDKNFKLPFVEEGNEDEVAPAIVQKSDQIRIVARTDVKILVVPPGVDASQADQEGAAAAIIIRRTGDIVFIPAAQSVIKLGGDDADRALLCTSSPADVLPTGPGGTAEVVAPPIATSMGGFVGRNVAGQGTYAARVLVTAGPQG